ncbi:MAG: DUF3006 domain-containing protein [Defluviitaleaceae bacterium]|nr:DUF3006 domain-containing protein [Defluviitaleaceae bacterium]MCL2275420.1 DUF3006 domain-containing protein [Defluviitaleaceae bacterium]
MGLDAQHDIVGTGLYPIIIDRFTEDIATCLEKETLRVLTFHRSELPPEAKAGDTLYFADNQWHINAEDTALRLARITERFTKIKQRVRRAPQRSEEA